jgi:hypothetical protein
MLSYKYLLNKVLRIFKQPEGKFIIEKGVIW